MKSHSVFGAVHNDARVGCGANHQFEEATDCGAFFLLKVYSRQPLLHPSSFRAQDPVLKS